LITGHCGATAAARLRFEEGRNVPEFVTNRRAIDSPERAANVHLALALHNFDAAPADSRVYVFIDPRPWDCGHLRQIDRPDSAAHIVAALPVSPWQMYSVSRALVSPT
jgi:hypothetical protein